MLATKRYSLVGLLKLNGESEPPIRIVIPQIQRDYVQGREDKKEIRQPFLTAIKAQMDANSSLNLDLIYGYIRNGHDFIPLDGQQRLTTIFLLHWYLACHDSRHGDFANLFHAGNQAHFEYQTRPSAKAFCDALCRENIEADALQSENSKERISTLIRDAAFFRDYWYFDPTVQAMLAMLNAIHELFANTSNYYDKLIADTEETPKAITFDYLNLDKLDSSDMLYIRMNDRGLSLSSFDTFKANLENYMRVTKHTNFEKFLKNVDGPWTNLIWDDKQPDTFDTAFMSLLSAFIINALAASTATTESTIKNLFDTILLKDVSFYSYKEEDVFCTETDEIGTLITKPYAERDTQVITYLVQGMSLLDGFLQEQNHSKELFKDYFNIENEFIKIQYKNVEAESGQRTRLYESRVLFHALIRYCMLHVDQEGLTHWMRIVSNLVQSVAPYDAPQDFIDSIRAIDTLLAQWDQGIVQALKQVSSGFDSTQLREEIVKQSLIDQDRRWDDLLRTAEIHPYFTGQIGFLLLLAEIDIAHDIGEIAVDEHTKHQESFRDAWEKAKRIFTENGLNSTIREFRWERALLAYGDYRLQSGKGRNHSLLINIDRDYSWKRFLKCHRKDAAVWEKQRKIIEKIFQEISTDDVIGSLDRIIASHKVHDWRLSIIDNWKVLEYYKNRLGFRIMQDNTPHGMILIPKLRVSSSHAEIRASSSHAEIRSYAFYCAHNEDTDNTFGLFGSPLQYYPVSGFPEPPEYPCAYLSGWKRDTGTTYGLDVAFHDDTYMVRCFARDSKPFEKDMKQVVSEDLAWQEDTDLEGFVRKLDHEDKVIPFIKELSDKLQTAFVNPV